MKYSLAASSIWISTVSRDSVRVCQPSALRRSNQHRVDITGNQAEPSVRACALDLHLAERSGSRFTDQGIRDRLGLDDLDTYGGLSGRSQH